MIARTGYFNVSSVITGTKRSIKLQLGQNSEHETTFLSFELSKIDSFGCVRQTLG